MREWMNKVKLLLEGDVVPFKPQEKPVDKLAKLHGAKVYDLGQTSSAGKASALQPNDYDKKVSILLRGIALSLSFYASQVEFLKTAAEMAKNNVDRKDSFLKFLENLPTEGRVNAPITHIAAKQIRVARENVKPWWDDFDGKKEINFDMTSMHLGDAADHLQLAIYVAEQDANAFKNLLRKMDTASRDEVDDAAYDWARRPR